MSLILGKSAFSDQIPVILKKGLHFSFMYKKKMEACRKRVLFQPHEVSIFNNRGVDHLLSMMCFRVVGVGVWAI